MVISSGSPSSADLDLREGRPRVDGLVGRLLGPITSAGNWNVELSACLSQCDIGDAELLGDCPHWVAPDFLVEILTVVAGHQARGHCESLRRSTGGLPPRSVSRVGASHCRAASVRARETLPCRCPSDRPLTSCSWCRRGLHRAPRGTQ